MRESKNQYFLKIASLVSTQSTCPRRAVGCVVIDSHGHIKATGFNGVPRSFDHCIQLGCGAEHSKSGTNLEKCMAIHAEQNALLQCSDVMSIDTIYVTTSPCLTCAKLISNTSCKKLIYSETYSNIESISMLEKAGIEVLFENII